MSHRVINASLRAQIAQGEMYRRHPREDYQDSTWETVDRLVKDTMTRIDQGHPEAAEYWLLQMECAGGVIRHEQLSERVNALGRFSLLGDDGQCL